VHNYSKSEVKQSMQGLDDEMKAIQKSTENAAKYQETARSILSVRERWRIAIVFGKVSKGRRLSVADTRIWKTVLKNLPPDIDTNTEATDDHPDRPRRRSRALTPRSRQPSSRQLSPREAVNHHVTPSRGYSVLDHGAPSLSRQGSCDPHSGHLLHASRQGSSNLLHTPRSAAGGPHSPRRPSHVHDHAPPGVGTEGLSHSLESSLATVSGASLDVTSKHHRSAASLDYEDDPEGVALRRRSSSRPISAARHHSTDEADAGAHHAHAAGAHFFPPTAGAHHLHPIAGAHHPPTAGAHHLHGAGAHHAHSASHHSADEADAAAHHPPVAGVHHSHTARHHSADEADAAAHHPPVAGAHHSPAAGSHHAHSELERQNSSRPQSARPLSARPLSPNARGMRGVHHSSLEEDNSAPKSRFRKKAPAPPPSACEVANQQLLARRMLQALAAMGNSVRKSIRSSFSGNSAVKVHILAAQEAVAKAEQMDAQAVGASANKLKPSASTARIVVASPTASAAAAAATTSETASSMSAAKPTPRDHGYAHEQGGERPQSPETESYTSKVAAAATGGGLFGSGKFSFFRKVRF
jgi:hypothetical protein